VKNAHSREGIAWNGEREGEIKILILAIVVALKSWFVSD